MISGLPIDISKIAKEDVDKEILRVGIISELDAINLYNQLATMSDNENIRKVMADISNEEKTHVGEFQTLLLRIDEEQKKELENGKNEVDELTK
ncbi:MAG: rubrerythrin [Patescibacteria group bacterium]|nr:rubrerythrin [Patescibacteria group bacterium]